MELAVRTRSRTRPRFNRCKHTDCLAGGFQRLGSLLLEESLGVANEIRICARERMLQRIDGKSYFVQPRIPLDGALVAGGRVPGRRESREATHPRPQGTSEGLSLDDSKWAARRPFAVTILRPYSSALPEGDL